MSRLLLALPFPIAALLLVGVKSDLIKPSSLVPESVFMLFFACTVLISIFFTLSEGWRALCDPVLRTQARKRAQQDRENKNYY